MSRLRLRDYQQRIIEESGEILNETSSLLVTAPTGAGKCHPLGTLVLKRDGGSIRVEQVETGELLAGPDGEKRTVLAVGKGYGQIVEIRPEDNGARWRCNLQHSLALLREENLEGGPEIIAVRDYLQLSREARKGLLGYRVGKRGEIQPYRFRVVGAGMGRYAGFRLEGDGLYLLEDRTVTHNTVVIAEIMAQAQERGERAALLVHRQELVEQSQRAIGKQAGGKLPGIVWKERREWEENNLILAQNTIMGGEIPEAARRLSVMLVDEAHHTVAPSWIRTIERIGPEKLIGFSATPFRQDREPLSPEPFARIIRPITPQELIDRGVLCPAVIQSPIIYNRKGDVEAVGKARNLPQVYREAVRHAIGQGRNKILLYVSQTPEWTPTRVMTETAELLWQDGIQAGVIGQGISGRKRKEEIEAFSRGGVASVLINYQALTEGTDIPLVDCVIIGRHTESESTIIQMIGRGLRKHPDKEDCLVLDYSGRADMSQIIHYWRLDGEKKEGEESNRERAKLTKAEMEELTVKFPAKIAGVGAMRVEYPWFRPYEGRPLYALMLGSGEEGEGRYVTVEPDRKGLWRVTEVRLMSRGPTPVRKEQVGGLEDQAAVNRIRSMLGDKAPQRARSAPWRMKEPTEKQKQAWRATVAAGKRRGETDPGSMPKRAGEVSDYLAAGRFRNTVRPEAI